MIKKYPKRCVHVPTERDLIKLLKAIHCCTKWKWEGGQDANVLAQKWVEFGDNACLGFSDGFFLDNYWKFKAAGCAMFTLNNALGRLAVYKNRNKKKITAGQYRMYARRILEDKNISSTQKVILCILLDHVGRSNIAVFPQNKIAQMLEIDYRSVWRWEQDLKKKKYIETIQNYGVKSRKAYVLLFADTLEADLDK